MDDVCVAGLCRGTALSPPLEVVGVMLAGSAPNTLTWEGQGTYFVYELVTGEVEGMRLTEGIGTASCLADDVPAAEYVDVRAGPLGAEGHYYLVRAANALATGGYGYSSSGGERIPLLDCP